MPPTIDDPIILDEIKEDLIKNNILKKVIKTYLFLIGAIFCEVAGTMLLPISQNFTKFIPTLALSIFYLIAFYLLTFVVNKLLLLLFMQLGVA